MAYPQEFDKQRGVSQKSKDIEKIVIELIHPIIEEKGYILVNDIYELMSNHIELSSNVEGKEWEKMPERIIKYEWKKMSEDVCDKYGYTKEPLNNALKKELGITHLTPQARPVVLHNVPKAPTLD
ncbi:hypothetical protein IV487_14715 [Enterococcus saccharolyticus]|nr:hypothetical protein [Enterococcus saccharolyticus]MCD5003714.1 hypothetical protein [Enterococcus saccharolyticus]